MPAYDYICSCGHTSEVNHGMIDTPAVICSQCGQIMKKKITGGSGVIYKGEGWAAKDLKLTKEKK